MKALLRNRPLVSLVSEGAIYVAGGLLGVGLIPLLGDVGRTWDIDGGRSALLVFTAGSLTGTLAQLLGSQRHPALAAWGLVARGAGLLGLVHLTDHLPKGSDGAPHPLALIITWLVGYLVIMRLSELIQNSAQRLLGLSETVRQAVTPMEREASPAPQTKAEPKPRPESKPETPIALVRGKPIRPGSELDPGAGAEAELS